MQRRGSLSDLERAVHLLHRATYGVTPEDVDAVLALGEHGWLDQQLRPDAIDDAETERRLGAIFSAGRRVSSPPPAAGPVRFMSGAGSPARSSAAPAADMRQETPVREQAARRHDEGWRLVREATRLELLAARVRGGLAERLRAEAAGLLSDGQRAMSDALTLSLEAAQQAAMRPPAPPPPPEWLPMAKLTRAVYSARQLEEVMTDFWFNHFNVFGQKDGIGAVLEDYERNAIRAHVFGRFEDMLLATARHPAMLMYLDAAEPPDSSHALPGVLNENYARELLELHTLGVHGGYTQADVIAVARAFTGWSVIDRPVAPPVPVAAGRARPPATIATEFVFRSQRHDRHRKVVLGRTLRAGRGIEDGLDVLSILAHHPSTAAHLAHELVRHFVADDPPPALVAEIAQVFRRTRGDLRAVTRALFTAEGFYDPAVFRAKAKRPFEYVASALRISGADAVHLGGLVQPLRTFGHLPYAEPSPTGYPSTREAWISAGALLGRMQFALDLTGGRIPEVRLPPADLGEREWFQEFEDAVNLLGVLLPRLLPAAPVADLEAALLDTADAWLDADAATTAATVLGIVIGSPEFQWY